jgi:hypothetical protein
MKPPLAANPVGFRFVDHPASWHEPATLVVRVPSRVRSKRGLLTEMVRQLRLPAYFGWNWDALDECLRDLHWLPAARRVALVHDGLPLRPGSPGRATYVRLLSGATQAWAPEDDHELLAVFPEQARQEIITLLAESAD